MGTIFLFCFQGFLQQDLAKESVVKISKQILCLQENLMKLLESLDALVRSNAQQ